MKMTRAETLIDNLLSAYFRLQHSHFLGWKVHLEAKRSFRIAKEQLLSSLAPEPVEVGEGLREALADVQHQIWKHWMIYLFGCLEPHDGTLLILPMDKVTRWTRQMDTPYSELSEKEKASDREQADKVLALIDTFRKP